MRAVNLIPHDQRRGAGGLAGRSGGIVYVVAGGLLVVVGLGVIYAFAVHSVANRKGELAQVTQQVGSVQLQTAALQPYVQVYNVRQAKVQAAVQLAQARFDWPDAMRQLALALPSDVTLTSLTANAASASSSATAAVPSTTTTVAGPTFVLAGCASSQSETALVLTRLEQTPGVTDVQLQSTTKQPSTGGIDAAPNTAPPGPLSKAEAVQQKCPLVGFNATVAYSPTYTLPSQKLPSSASNGAQTVSTHASASQTAAAPPATVNK